MLTTATITLAALATTCLAAVVALVAKLRRRPPEAAGRQLAQLHRQQAAARARIATLERALAEQQEQHARCIDEAEKSREQLYQLAYYDSLTSLPNRRLFREQLEQLLRLAQRSGEQLALLFIDLDNFKRINDGIGHSAGDRVLQTVAQRVRDCLRNSDLVALYVDAGPSIDVSRIGGDEFTAVLSRLEESVHAGMVAERIIAAVTQPIEVEGHELVVTTSIGIALAPGDASAANDLLKAADTAMYYAKSRGKNSHAFYQEHMQLPSRNRARLEADLRQAQAAGQLELHYQPQVDIRTAAVVGAEALLRWNHPEFGLVPPLRFIPIAEEMNIINELGRWTIAEACHQLQAFKDRGLKLPRITVNVSALQFNMAFVDSLAEVLEEAGVAPAQLQLEFREGVALKDIGESLEILKELKRIGVGLCIDDFGTGYSPLGYLNRFPLDAIKVDRSYISRLHASSEDANLVAAIIDLARHLQLDLAAEGVENVDHYRFLRDQGVYVQQGYLFSEPVPAARLETLLAPQHFLARIQSLAAQDPH